MARCVVCNAKLSTNDKPDLCPFCNNLVFYHESGLKKFVRNLKKDLTYALGGCRTMMYQVFIFSAIMVAGMLGCIAVWAGWRYM
jgi:hypothetical protein